MTLDQAAAHIEGIRNDWRGTADSFRARGEEYLRAANDADDADLRRLQFEQASEFFARAREYDRDADALTILLDTIKERI